MPTLHLDDLTASVSLTDLADRGNDLVTLAQAVDEDWARFASDPKSGTRHMISTMGNRQDCPPTGQAYYNTSFIQPDAVDARDRPISERFLRGKPLLCAEIQQVEDGYRMETALLRIPLHVHAVLDWEGGSAKFYIQSNDLPETVLVAASAASGRRLGDIVDIGHQGHLAIRELRRADEKEMRSVLGHLSQEGLVVETDLPGWQKVEFDVLYGRSWGR